ncbi:MAG: sugar transferase [bacterium]|nr:sugar transferase [bacterium]
MDISAVIAAAEGAFLLRFWGPINDLYPAVMIPTRGDYLSSLRDRSFRPTRPRNRTDLAWGDLRDGTRHGRDLLLSRVQLLPLDISLDAGADDTAARGCPSYLSTDAARLFQRGIGVLRIAVWGSGKEAVRLWMNLADQKSRGFDLVGALGPAPSADWRTLGDVSALRALWQEHELDAVMLAPSSDEEPRLGEVARAAEGTPLELLYMPLAVDYSRSRVVVTEISGKPVLKLKTLTMAGLGYVAKRLMDFSVSALIIVGFSLLYALIAIAVYLDSGKPLLYRQRRVGMDGNEFDMLKFRTMKTDAESGTGAVWAVRNDPRVTRVGRFLRRWSLDELPQFWSVLRGDMSLVGPRPERPEFVYKFAEYIPNYLDRHRVKAGLTGWAVVNGFRGSETTIEERTAYDLYYVENWSLWLDIRILLRTFAAVISGKGAM